MKILPIRLKEKVEQRKKNSLEFPFMFHTVFQYRRKKVLKWYTVYKIVTINRNGSNN